MADPVILGYLPNEIRRADVPQCEDCGSKNIKTHKEMSQPDALRFVQSRASRMGLVLANFNISIDKESGMVSATPRPIDTEGVSFV